MRDVSLELQKAQMELRLWQDYRLLYESCSKHLNLYWEQCEAFLSLPKKQEYDIKLLHSRIKNVSVSDSQASTLQPLLGKYNKSCFYIDLYTPVGMMMFKSKKKKTHVIYTLHINCYI